MVVTWGQRGGGGNDGGWVGGGGCGGVGVVAVVVEDEARGGAWSGRSDRSGGGESFGTRPENSPKKFSGGGWPERRWLPDFEREEGVCRCLSGLRGLHYLLYKVVQAGMYRDLSLRTSGPLQDPTTTTITTITITNIDGMRRVRTFEKQYPQNKVQLMRGARGRAYAIGDEIWYSVANLRMNQLH
ncbi:hypothetical protein Tco_0281000 [Tanacetum coccineum]